MAGQTGSEQFESSWSQTASWAQQQGYKYNQYYPVYQQDSQRYLNGGHTMSTAEREVAIQAAADPGQATQKTPSTSSNPWNIIGNTINDARNLFTGIGDIAIHPLHNGLVDSLYNSFDLLTGAHHLAGSDEAQKIGDALTSTVLSWIPGAADLGQVIGAQNSLDPLKLLTSTKGLSLLAEHPISSLLDVLPIANKAVGLKVASDAGFAESTGLDAAKGTPEYIKPSVYRAGKGFLMHTDLKDIPENYGPDGNLMTIGDKLSKFLGGSVLNSNAAIHDAVQGSEITNAGQTFVGQYLFTPLRDAEDHLDAEQKAKLDDLMDPAKESSYDARLKQMEVDDPAVAEAARAMDGPRAFQQEENLAQEGARLVKDPKSGKLGFFTQQGHPDVIQAADDLQKTTDQVLRQTPGLETLADQSDKAVTVAGMVTDQLEQVTNAARQAHDSSDAGVIQGIRIHGTKRAVGWGKKNVEEDWFDTGGKMDKLIAKARDGHYLEVGTLIDAWLKRMDSWSPTDIDASEKGLPQFQRVRQQMTQLKQVTDHLLQLRKAADEAVYGKGKAWEGQTPFRDEMHENAVKALKAKHGVETQAAKDAKTLQFNRVTWAYKLLRRSISTKYSNLMRESDAKVQEINERWELEKAKATTKNLLEREAHGEWKRARTAQGFTKPRDRVQAIQEGWEVSPGGRGTPEALGAAHDALEVQKQAELALVTPKSVLRLQMKNEIKDSQIAEDKMTDTLKRAYDKRDKDLTDRQTAEKDALRKENLGKRAREGEVSDRFNAWTKAKKGFEETIWKHPSDNNTDLYFNILAKHIVKNEEATRALSEQFAEKHGYTEEHLQNLRANPQVMSQLIQQALMATERDPIFDSLDPEFLDTMVEEAKAELADLNKWGIFPEYISHVSTSQMAADGTGSYAIQAAVGKGIPKPDALSPRTWAMDTSKFDLMAGVHRGVKQVLEAKSLNSFVRNYLTPHVISAAKIKDTIDNVFRQQLKDLDRESVPAFYSQKIKDWGLEQFDPDKDFGFRPNTWDPGAVYIDKDLMKAVRNVTAARNKTDLGTFDKATRLFRFSILGLSPRYTAHITFGGSFLLALRSTPYMPLMLGKAIKGLKAGEFDMDMYPSMTQLGTTQFELSAKHASDEFGTASGHQQVKIAAGEHIETVQKVKLAAATPIHWIKALADINFHFTNYVTKLQRSVAMLDYAAKAEREAARHPITDEFGNTIEMTRERAMMEGMKHAEAVFGDLRRMSPFERTMARTAVPFWGWEKHILQYVMSFPADHPWRAMMLANMAEFDSANTPGGLPSRYQFLFFLGHPDDQGNVSALDLRAINPLRDVANYATLGGIISSLNPVVTAGFTAVDPSIIYGGNELYPNLTYDQFYGIETAGPQGNLMTGLEQVVPQLSAIQSAMQVAGQRQSLSKTSLIKNIYESLNIPFAQVQHINLRQEAAKTAIARYQVTSNLAQQAWTSGDFQPISDLGSVPDPQNPDYEIPVDQLQQLYNTLAAEYPGQPPSETATPLPSVHL